VNPSLAAAKKRSSLSLKGLLGALFVEPVAEVAQVQTTQLIAATGFDQFQPKTRAELEAISGDTTALLHRLEGYLDSFIESPFSQALLELDAQLANTSWIADPLSSRLVEDV
jgi:hypothetical protein